MCVPGLVVEFESFAWGITADGGHYKIVEIRFPAKSGAGKLLDFMYFDPVISQDGSAHLARGLAEINEKNFYGLRGERPRSGGGDTYGTPSTVRPIGCSHKVCAATGRESSGNSLKGPTDRASEGSS